MFKHTVTYKDFNENDRKEDLYFHLATHEVIRLEAEIGQPLEEYITQLQANNELKELLAFLEKMMLSSYGQKTSDGKSFSKTQAIRDTFEYSQAYAEFFEDLITQPDLAKKFGEGVSDKSNLKKKNQLKPVVVTDEKQ